MIDRILLLDFHSGLFLLKNDFSLPRLLLSLRSAPCHHHPELLAEYDEVTCSTTEALCNIHFDDNCWSLAKLPVQYGGLELRTAADLALLAFLSSRAERNSLVNHILCQPTNTPEAKKLGRYSVLLSRRQLGCRTQPVSSSMFQGGFAS